MYAEFDLIAKIAARFAAPDGVTLGIGDDSAVLDPGRFDLVTTDTLVEGVHFRRDWSSAEDIGWKLLATSLSDIAAMGGAPGVFFLNMTLPRDLDEAFVDGLIEGLDAARRELVPPGFEVSVGGGDTTSTAGPIVLTLTLMGEASPAGPVLRQGAVPGDRIAILGHVGLAQGAVELLSGAYAGADPLDFPAMLAAHRRPRPRVHPGALLGLFGVPSSMIDVSDGLIQDLGHILKRSAVGAAIETHSLPRHAEQVILQERFGADVLTQMLTGGDDYELLLTAPPARMPKLWELARKHGWDVYDIGEVRGQDEGLRVLGPTGQPLEGPWRGWSHF
jgi:thiamine-monophosphate kinase